MTETKALRVLVYDIETSLQLVSVFQLGNNDWIKPSAIVTERHMISVCWQWLDENVVHSVSLLDDPDRFAKDPHDDYHVVEKFHEVYSQADAVVTHNGDSFDNKWVATRVLYHKLPPLPPVTSIDTNKIAKKHFYFNSNSLDYIASYLGFGHKKRTPVDLWARVLRGEAKAIEIMVAYNKKDVSLLKRVFLRLRPFIPSCMNRELAGQTGCPRCGSSKVQSRGTYYALTRTYRRWQCAGECRGWFRTLKADEKSSTEHRVV